MGSSRGSMEELIYAPDLTAKKEVCHLHSEVKSRYFKTQFIKRWSRTAHRHDECLAWAQTVPSVFPVVIITAWYVPGYLLKLQAGTHSVNNTIIDHWSLLLPQYGDGNEKPNSANSHKVYHSRKHFLGHGRGEEAGWMSTCKCVIVKAEAGGSALQSSIESRKVSQILYLPERGR